MRNSIAKIFTNLSMSIDKFYKLEHFCNHIQYIFQVYFKTIFDLNIRIILYKVRGSVGFIRSVLYVQGIARVLFFYYCYCARIHVNCFVIVTAQGCTLIVPLLLLRMDAR